MDHIEIDSLKNELDHERTCRDSAAWQNGELEKQIASIHDELRKSDYPWDHDDDLVKENAKHKVYLDTIETLREQMPALKEKIKAARICGPDCRLKHDDLNINLDLLTPAELLRTVKRFERLKTDLISTLRSKEWRLDSESKLFVRVHDQRTYLQNELLICQNNIMRLQKNGGYWQDDLFHRCDVPDRWEERTTSECWTPSEGP
ncbi:uncharacterized protein LOC142980616 isoform X2 [Anticarsia gemmatalis]|uniref:uncharacterized protein LOC142980616 isoform X2 n=1 Tax=Anticarsia gemmatalis TaxID=129554 RepID=UPI003F76AD26